MKWEYEKKATDDIWEDDLLQVRIRARNNNLSIVQNEKNRPSLLSLVAGKSKEEQIRLSKLHYPEYSDDFLNEVF